MRNARLASIVLSLAAAGCASPADGLPSSVRDRIAEFEAVAPARPPRSVYRTDYGGRPAYFITSACCDIPSELYDERGTLICYPGGSFAGGDKRCPGYGLPASATLVWQDKRPARQREAK